MEKLKITTEKNHYFLYSSFFQKNDFRFNHIEANDIGQWSKLIGILFNIDLFDEYIINNSDINVQIRHHLQNIRLVLLEYMGYNDEDSLIKINSMIDQEVIYESMDDRIKYLGVTDLIRLKEKECYYRKIILIMEKKYKSRQSLIDRIGEEPYQKMNMKKNSNIEKNRLLEKHNTKEIKNLTLVHMMDTTIKNGSTTTNKNVPAKNDIELKENEFDNIDDYLSVHMKKINGIVISKQDGIPIYLKEYIWKQNFSFKINEYKFPETFIDYDTWSQKKLKDVETSKLIIDTTLVTDVCIESITLRYQLNYLEVYGRLIGINDLIKMHRYKELNDNTINACIATMTYYANKETRLMKDNNNSENKLSEEVFIPEVYIATTYLHRYFSPTQYDMKKAKCCFYGITRGDDRYENQIFFDTNKIILIPWNYSNIHWILVFVDIKRPQFSVLDSLNNRNPEINIEQ